MRFRLPILDTTPRSLDPRVDAYPMPRVPHGWYAVLESDELREGEVKSLHSFGRELVAFRGRDGRATVLDAYCPHYGSHLGVGGRVVDGTVECPFHGWRFDTDGTCAHAPFAERPPRASVTCHAVREHSGLVFVHVGEGAPTWEVPELPEHGSPEFAAPFTDVYRARTHVQEMRENIVDESHFHFIHRQDRPAEQGFVADGPHAHVEGRLRKRVFGVLVDNDFVIDMYGPGVMVVRTNGPRFRATAIALTTPIDDTTSELRLVTYLAKTRASLVLHPLREILFRVITWPEVNREVEIWNHKVYQQRPIFLPHEAGIRKLRSWYAQFYEGRREIAVRPAL